MRFTANILIMTGPSVSKIAVVVIFSFLLSPSMITDFCWFYFSPLSILLSFVLCKVHCRKLVLHTENAIPHIYSTFWIFCQDTSGMVRDIKEMTARWTAGCKADNVLQDIFHGNTHYRQRKVIEIPPVEVSKQSMCTMSTRFPRGA